MIEKRNRVMMVAEMILSFHSTWQIKEACKDWGISERMVDTYISQAKQMIRESIGDDFENQLKERIAQGYALLQKAIERGNLQTAASLYIALNKIGGFESSKVETTHRIDFTISTVQAPALAPAPATIRIDATPGDVKGLQRADGQPPEGGDNVGEAEG